MSPRSFSPFRLALPPRPRFAQIDASVVSAIQSCAGASAGRGGCRAPAGEFNLVVIGWLGLRSVDHVNNPVRSRVYDERTVVHGRVALVPRAVLRRDLA